MKHCDGEAIFGSAKVKKIKTIVYCPGEKPRFVVRSELHKTADLGVFAVDTPFDVPQGKFKIKASQAEEEELLKAGKCSSWGYGPDNKGKSGTLNGVELSLLPSTRMQTVPGSKARTMVSEKSFVHQPYKAGINHTYPGVDGIGIKYLLHPFLYLEEKGAFQSSPGDSGGPIFCENPRGDVFLIGVNLSSAPTKLKNGRKIVALGVPVWPYSAWIEKAKAGLAPQLRPHSSPSFEH